MQPLFVPIPAIGGIQVDFAVLINTADAGHKKVIKEAMNESKELLKIWVAIFKKKIMRTNGVIY